MDETEDQRLVLRRSAPLYERVVAAGPFLTANPACAPVPR
jgi:hypothetical protein